MPTETIDAATETIHEFHIWTFVSWLPCRLTVCYEVKAGAIFAGTSDHERVPLTARRNPS